MAGSCRAVFPSCSKRCLCPEQGLFPLSPPQKLQQPMLLLIVRGVFTATDGGPCRSTECAFPTREFMGTDNSLAVCGLPWDVRRPKTCRHQVGKTCGHQDFQHTQRSTKPCPLCSGRGPWQCITADANRGKNPTPALITNDIFACSGLANSLSFRYQKHGVVSQIRALVQRSV